MTDSGTKCVLWIDESKALQRHVHNTFAAASLCLHVPQELGPGVPGSIKNLLLLKFTVHIMYVQIMCFSVTLITAMMLDCIV